MGLWEMLWRLAALALFTAMTAGGLATWFACAAEPKLGHVALWGVLLLACGAVGMGCLLVDGLRALRRHKRGKET